MRKFILIITLFTCVFTVQSQEKKSIHLIDAQTFKKAITGKNVQLIDVRTIKEYEEHHIKNAINIDFYKKNFLSEFEKLDKQKPVYIYCKSGGRSGKAAKKLSEIGFKEVYDLKGGVLEYDK